MKTTYYMLLVLMGLILSIPMTIIMVAIQQAKDNTEKMEKHLRQ